MAPTDGVVVAVATLVGALGARSAEVEAHRRALMGHFGGDVRDVGHADRRCRPGRRSVLRSLTSRPNRTVVPTRARAESHAFRKPSTVVWPLSFESWNSTSTSRQARPPSALTFSTHAITPSTEPWKRPGASGRVDVGHDDELDGVLGDADLGGLEGHVVAGVGRDGSGGRSSCRRRPSVPVDGGGRGRRRRSVRCRRGRCRRPRRGDRAPTRPPTIGTGFSSTWTPPVGC